MMFLIIALILLIVSNCIFFYLMIRFMKKSVTDELTGLNNFRYLKLYLKNKRKNNQLGLAILDINNFKVFNNISIHKGDNILQEFSEEMKMLLGENVLICRYRLGDEFALVFLNKSKSEIQVALQVMITYFNTFFFKCLEEDMPDYSISFCYGISELATDEANFETLFYKAESELATAKREKELKMSQ